MEPLPIEALLELSVALFLLYVLQHLIDLRHLDVRRSLLILLLHLLHLLDEFEVVVFRTVEVIRLVTSGVGQFPFEFLFCLRLIHCIGVFGTQDGLQLGSPITTRREQQSAGANC